MPKLQQPAVIDETPAPQCGQVVRVHGCNQRRCSAIVMQAAQHGIELQLNEDDADPETIRELVDAPTVVVEFLADEAMHRLYAKAHLNWAGDGAALYLLPRGGTQMLGRRRHLRTELEAVAMLQRVGAEERFDGWVVNMSVGGMLIDKLAEPVEFDEYYDFSIVPRREAESITGAAKVVRVEGPTCAAFQITQLDTPTADELVRMLFEDSEIRRAAR